MARRTGQQPAGGERGEQHADPGQAARAKPGAEQADQQRDGCEAGQFVHRHRGESTQSRPVIGVPAGDHAGAARRRGEQPDAQEAARQGEPECHGECDQRSVELLPLGEMCRHARWVTRRRRCVKLAPRNQ